MDENKQKMYKFGIEETSYILLGGRRGGRGRGGGGEGEGERGRGREREEGGAI